MLNYSSVENPLSATPGNLILVPANVRSYSMDEITKRILARNPGIGASQINASLEEFVEEVCIIIADGGAVNTPIFNSYPSFTGEVENATDSFDPKRNRIKTNLQPSTRIHKATAGIKTQKVQVAETLPYILEVKDVVTNSRNEFITPGGVIQLVGGRLKLAIENSDNGIFLLDAQANATKLVHIVENKPSRLIAMVPATLLPGAYTVEVRTNLSGANKETKNIKAGRFQKELTAVATGVEDGDNENSGDNG